MTVIVQGILTRKVTVPVDDLIEAFDTHFEETAYYLDLQNGKMILVSEIDDSDNLKEKIESDTTGRYVYVEPIPSSEGYRHMEDFITTVPEKNLQEKLVIAISGKGAFRRFKEVLLMYPEQRQRWFDFHEKMIKKYAKEWINDLNRELEKNPKAKYGDTIIWIKWGEMIRAPAVAEKSTKSVVSLRIGKAIKRRFQHVVLFS